MTDVRVEQPVHELEESPVPESPSWVPDPDYDGWSDGQVAAELEKVRAEHARRQTMAAAVLAVEAAAATFRAAAGISDGSQYRPPTGAHDAVPAGETRVFEGDLWRNVSGGVLAHSPAEYPQGWEVVEEGAEPTVPDPGEFPQWTPGVDYVAGDVVAYEGGAYEVLQGHTSADHWRPDQVASLYRRA